jgi:hypothetical protein
MAGRKDSALRGNAEQLIEDCRALPLVLLTGAGIMAPGPGTRAWLVPQWEELLKRLLGRGLGLRFREAETGVKPDDLLERIVTDRSYSCYAQASLIKVLFDRQYLHELREELYRTYHGVCESGRSLPGSVLCRYPFLQSVIELCRCRRVSAVVNYNFDDILERCVSTGEGKRPAYSVSGPLSERVSAGALPIYHVHGYLPHGMRAPDPEGSAVVLSEDEYLTNMAQPYSWQTTTQLHFLRNAACLFVGVSMTDVDMLRVLQHAHNRTRTQSVYAVMAERATRSAGGPTGADVDYILTRLKATLLDSLGVRLIVAADYASIPDVVSEIARRLPTP